MKFLFASRKPLPIMSRMNQKTKELKVGYNKRDNCFFGRYKLNNVWKTKFIPTSITTETEAKEWFRNFLETMKEKEAVPSNSEVIKKIHTIATVFPLIEEYWTNSRRNKAGDKLDPQTSADWISKVKGHILDHPISNVPLTAEKFTPVAIIDWLEAVKNKELATYTIKDTRFVLKTLIADGRKKGWIDLNNNPVADEIVKSEVPVGCPRSGKDNPIHLSKEEVIKLLSCESNSIPLDRKVKYVLALTSGCRDGELMGLCWRHIDLDKACILIERQLNYGPASVSPPFTKPKKKSDRTLPLHPLAVQALTYWKEVMKAQDCDPVFPDSEGSYYRGKSANQFRHDLLAAGISDKFQGQFDFDFHSTRRTFMTMLEDADVSPETAGILAGHAMKGVRKHYVASHLERFVKEIQKLPLEKVTLNWTTRKE
jgi:integrase